MVALLSSSLFYLSSCNKSTKKLPNNVTFVEHIAPIIHTNCTPCHKEGGGAPFELITFNNVSKRSKMVAFVTSTKYMPPWPADRTYSHFANERGLSQYEIDLITKWYKTGAERGEGKVNYEKSIQSKRKPDLVIPVKPMQIIGNNRDQFYVVKVPFEIPKDTFVNVVEFISGKNQVVHHANGHLLNFNFDKKSTVFEGEYFLNVNSTDSKFIEDFNSLQLRHDDGSYPSRVHSALNYLPGMDYMPFPDGIGGFPISRKGTFVLNDIHYGPYPKTILDSSYINVYFSPNPPQRPFQEVMLGTNGVSEIIPPLVVPPNEVKKFTTQWQVPFDISLVSINPHMHLLGKSIKAYALKPNGDSIPLIKIPKWDFRWQYVYTFDHLLKLPKGTIIKVEAVFDNTDQNPNNPFIPPREIGERMDKNGSSMRTTDEMLQFIITALPYKKGDEDISLKKD